MFKKYRRLFILAFPLAGIVILFQNCSKQQTFQTGSENENQSAMSSTTEELPTQTYVPRDNHPDIVKEKTVVQTDSETLLADRRYIKSVFENVFGPNFENGIDLSGVLGNAGNFSDLCSIYRVFRDKVGTRFILNDRQGEICPISDASTALGAVSNPKPTVVRNAWIVDACTKLVESSGNINAMFTKISTQSPPAVNATNIRKMVALFYAGKNDVPSRVTDSFASLINSSPNLTDGWKSATYTVCISPYWQVL